MRTSGGFATHTKSSSSRSAVSARAAAASGDGGGGAAEAAAEGEEEDEDEEDDIAAAAAASRRPSRSGKDVFDACAGGRVGSRHLDCAQIREKGETCWTTLGE
jgi:hypothetical protein